MVRITHISRIAHESLKTRIARPPMILVEDIDGDANPNFGLPSHHLHSSHDHATYRIH
jgi:hypothetical protein